MVDLEEKIEILELTRKRWRVSKVFLVKFSTEMLLA